MKFPLCEKAGLQMRWCVGDDGFVPMSDVEALLARGQEVKGFFDGDLQIWGNGENAKDTHTARVVMIEEIKKEPVKAEFVGTPYHALTEFPAKIASHELDRFVGRKVRVTVEEIQE